MSNTFNFRNPNPGEVKSINYAANKLRYDNETYRILQQLLTTNDHVDITKSDKVFEAINKEKMDFEKIMNLPHNQKEIKDTIEAVKEDRQHFRENTWWNKDSKAKWGMKGHIPKCCYYARPEWYWKDKELVHNFFNTFTKFRISSKPLK